MMWFISEYHKNPGCCKFQKFTLVYSLLLSFTFTSSLKSQINRDSLSAIWKNSSKADTVRLVALERISDSYTRTLPDTCIKLANELFDFAQKRNLKKFMAKAFVLKGNAYQVKSDHTQTLESNKEALKIFKEIKNEKGIAKCLNNIGGMYSRMGDDLSALDYYYKTLKIFRKIKDESGEAVTLSNLANICARNEKSDSALALLNQSLEIHTRLHDKMRMANVLYQIGKIKHITYKQTEAADYVNRSIALFTELKENWFLSHSYTTLAQIHLDQKRFAQAKQFADLSLAIAYTFKDSLSIGQNLMVLASVAHNTGNTEKAISLGKEAIQILKNANAMPLAMNEAIFVAMWYAEQNKYEKALDMYNFFVSNFNKGTSDKVKQELFRQQLKYDFEKKELLAAAQLEAKLNKMKADAEKESFRKNVWIIGISTLLFILILGSYLLFKNYTQKNIIADQKNNLLKQQLLVSQMNPHFIFNSLTAVQNFIFRQDSLQAGVYLKKFSELIRMILDFSRKDFISLGDEYIFLQNYLALQKLRFDNKLNYEVNIDPQLEMDMVMIPPMLAQPFIENAIEHGIFYKNGEGFLSIKISLKGNTLLYEIEDDGIGLNESLKLKSKLEKKHKSLALEITKERLENLNARNNTSFEIEIKDKVLTTKETSGVYVKFATPYLTL